MRIPEASVKLLRERGLTPLDEVFPHPQVALVGYGRAGKDEAAKALIDVGYTRHNFGDVIKRQLDRLIYDHFGYSAFTEVDEQKSHIRHLLEHWGDINYESVFETYFSTLPRVAVNTRLVRVEEALEWKRLGGIIISVSRPGRGPLTQWEADNYKRLKQAQVINGCIVNNASIEQLHLMMLRAARIVK